jgi:hypothetical protein
MTVQFTALAPDHTQINGSNYDARTIRPGHTHNCEKNKNDEKGKVDVLFLASAIAEE